MVADNNLKKLKRFNTLSRLHRQAAANLGFRQVSRLALRELLDVFRCDCCAILVTSADRYVALTEKSFSDAYSSEGLIQNIPAVDYTVKTGQALSTGKTPANLPSGDSIPFQRDHSIICVPVLVKDTTCAVIYIGACMQNVFDGSDLDYAKTIARELSKAYKNVFPLYQTYGNNLFEAAFTPLAQRRFDRDLISQIASAEWERKPLSLLIIHMSNVAKNGVVNTNSNITDTENDIVRKLYANLRPLDNIYHHGSRDFAVLLPETSRNNALLIANRIRNVLEAGMSGHPTAAPIRIGVSNFPQDADYRDGLVKKAYHSQYETAG